MNSNIISEEDLRQIKSMCLEILEISMNLVKKTRQIIAKINKGVQIKDFISYNSKEIKEEAIARKILADHAFDTITDPLNIIDTTPAFIKVIEGRNTEKIFDNREEFPLYAEAWFGDSYDKKGIKGLEAMRKFYDEKLKIQNLTSIVQECL